MAGVGEGEQGCGGGAWPVRCWMEERTGTYQEIEGTDEQHFCFAGKRRKEEEEESIIIAKW
jgi:hypothetical protein